MRPRILIAPLVAAAATACFADELPPASATDVWEPVPPVVSAPEGGVPSDAIVLFDGKSLDAWESSEGGAARWALTDGAMQVTPKTGNIRTKRGFGDAQLHIEFRCPAEVTGKGQHRGNSGIFLMGLYELQVLDSYENPTYVNGQAGAIYKQHIPLVNPARKPGEWQSYDIVFVAPRFDSAGNVEKPARFTVFLNGVLVQNDVVAKGPTVNRGTPKYKAHADKLPIELQNHAGDPVAYRNIWIRELNLP